MYDNLKQEMLSHSITNQQWNDLIHECKILINTDKLKQIVCNGNDQSNYGEIMNNALSLAHLQSIKLYTDFTTFCNSFCNVFRLKKLTLNSYESVNSLERRNSKYANCAKLLIESVQCYGTLLVQNKRNVKYYRGLNLEFMFPKFITRFYVPLSTTTDLTAATMFAEGGLVMELRKYNYGADVACFYCSAISSFDREEEALFFGSTSILQISSIYQWYDKKWSSYRRYIKAITNILNIVHGSTICEQALSWYDKNQVVDLLQYTLNKSYNNNHPSYLPPYIERLLNYHLQNIPYQIEYDYSQLVEDDQNKWLNSIFMKKNECDLLNISNICNLFMKCRHIIITMPYLFVVNEKFIESLIDDIIHIRRKNIQLEFKWESNAVILENKSIFNQFQDFFDKLHLKLNVIDQKTSIIIILPTNYYEQRLRSTNISTISNNPVTYQMETLQQPSNYNYFNIDFSVVYTDDKK
eukprot:443025_1